MPQSHKHTPPATAPMFMKERALREAFWPVSRSTFHRARTEPGFPAPTVIGGSRFYRTRSFLTWLESHDKEGTDK